VLICGRCRSPSARRRLQNILPKGSATIGEALSVTGTGNKLFELMCAHDLEGIVAKRLREPGLLPECSRERAQHQRYKEMSHDHPR
jgi:hypothetical protein